MFYVLKNKLNNSMEYEDQYSSNRYIVCFALVVSLAFHRKNKYTIDT